MRFLHFACEDVANSIQATYLLIKLKFILKLQVFCNLLDLFYD